MVDPIQAVSMSWIETHTYREDKTIQEQPITKAAQSSKSEQDSLSISFNLYGDLNKLSESMAVLNQKVKDQLEKHFSQVPVTDAQKAEFQPPENASAQQLMDFFTPENTAKRITNFATGFFDLYLNNHPGASDEENGNKFADLIQLAIKKGFDDAESILGDFNQLGDIGKAIQETYRSVLTNIHEFRTEFISRQKNNNETPAAGNTDSQKQSSSEITNAIDPTQPSEPTKSVQ